MTFTRAFGQDALGSTIKQPSVSYAAIKLLLGVSADSTSAARYRAAQAAVSAVVGPAEGREGAVQVGKHAWLAEELLAMQFEYARVLAEETYKMPVREAVVTVCLSFFLPFFLSPFLPNSSSV